MDILQENSESIKRTDYLTWEEHFIGLLLLTKQKEPHCKYAATIIIDERKIMISEACGEHSSVKALEEICKKNNTQFPITIYTIEVPCERCMEVIAGRKNDVKEIVYLKKNSKLNPDEKFAGINIRKFATSRKSITIDLSKYYNEEIPPTP